ncbi:MAG TPA: hypothetical protein PLX02_00155 [Syntrophorhabdaceae bacterium]|nr:hypothetical protein [Syntrophorhabdaceae bacterium]HQM80009.1 hypothetical protein [Syntrophorhabdaceae bacterium]
MVFLYAHAILMCTGFLFLFTGLIIARTMKRKAWWLKLHRMCGISGASCAALGFCVVFLDIALAGGQHLSTPHGYIGIVAVVLAIAAPVLGFMQFRAGRRAKVIKGFHIWSGRIALLLMLINIILKIY